MLTAEFIGHFDYSPNVLEFGDETLLITTSGAIADRSSSIWRLDNYGMKQLTPRSFDFIDYGRVVANRLLFFPDTADGREVWVTDGTEDGTQRVFTPAGAAPVRSNNSIALDDKLYFPQRDELWVTDGTAEGTHIVIDTDPSQQPCMVFGCSVGSNDPDIVSLTAFQDSIFFTIWRSDQTELWQSDGTTEGTLRMTDMNSGPESSFERNIVGRFFSRLNVAHDYLYFTTGTPARHYLGTVEGTGMNLWRLSLTDDANNTNDDVIDSIYAAIAAESYEPRFDLVDDDKLDESDVQYLVEEVLQTQFGDTNLDGDVDFADLLQLSSNFGLENSSWSQGDFNGDGNTGFADFLLLSSNFGLERS